MVAQAPLPSCEKIVQDAAMSSDETAIRIAARDGVGILTIDRPQARNALTYGMYERIRQVFANPASFGAERALVITGGATAFASGTEISHLRDLRSAADVVAYEERIERVLAAIEGSPVPTIAAISGACAGGGLIVAACCDIRIAAADARFGVPIARTLGNSLSLANLRRFVALIGHARLRELILSARLVGAEEARAIGLVSEVASDHAAVLARAEELAGVIAGHAPLTLRATKRSLIRLVAEDYADVLETYLSADFREGIEAFLGKRKPMWRGK
jgi:enoyl-CoA hydratase/carnithine racemase